MIYAQVDFTGISDPVPIVRSYSVGRFLVKIGVLVMGIFLFFPHSFYLLFILGLSISIFNRMIPSGFLVDVLAHIVSLRLHERWFSPPQQVILKLQVVMGEFMTAPFRLRRISDRAQLQMLVGSRLQSVDIRGGRILRISWQEDGSDKILKGL